MWLILALVAGLTVGIVEKDNIGKAFDSGIKAAKETSNTVIEKTKEYTDKVIK
jgi:hypothetical protein